jgi:hypothetical protein
MTPKLIGRRMAHARRLLAMRVLRPGHYLVFETLVWGQDRPRLCDTVVCSYANLVDALHVSSKTVAEAIRRLAGLGLIAVRKRFALVPWGHGKRWMQLENEYRIVPDDRCDFPALPPKQSSKQARKVAHEMKEGKAGLSELETMANRDRQLVEIGFGHLVRA